jgi:uncharacterized membrane protein (DUF4010 family)
MDLLERPEWRLAVATVIGLIVGVERERRKGDGPGRNPAGIRTFALVALLGGLAGQSGSEALVVLAGTFVAGAALAGYALGDRSDPGLTSEVALMLTYVLGVLAQRQPELALGVGVSVTVLLAVRSNLHHAIKKVLTERELIDALTFAVVALVVLPLVPDRAVDPLGVLNPFTLWRLVVVVMAITGAGYVAQRLIGPRYGLPLSGFASGFVSSTATIAAMGARARGDARLLAPAVAGAAASTVATFVQLAIVVGTVNPLLLGRLGWPLGLGGFVALLYATIWVMRTARVESVPPSVVGQAFDLRAVLGFSLVVAAVTVLSALLERWLGTVGVLVAAGTAGLADAHATAASVASINAAGKLDSSSAVLGVLIALSSNILSKAVFASSAGSRAFALWVQLGLLIVLVSAWLGFAVFAR